MEGQTAQNVETGHARARTYTNLFKSQNVAFRPALLSGCSRSSAYLHKKFNFGLICLAHLHLLLSVPFLREKGEYIYVKLVRKRKS